MIQRAMDASRIVATATELMRAAPYLVVCTTGSDGDVHARQIQMLAIEDDLELWFGTSPRSRKVAEIAQTGRVTVVAEVFDRNAYAAMGASAEIVTDADERSAHWTDALSPFFPGGPAGDDFVLVRLVGDWVEVMDFSSRIHPEPFGLVPAVAVRVEGGWREEPAVRDGGSTDFPPG